MADIGELGSRRPDPDRVTLASGGVEVVGHLARPERGRAASGHPGLVLCHGFPSGPKSAPASGQTYPGLADRLAEEAGWVVLSIDFRGTGSSGGNFSLGGWLTDLRVAVDHLLAMDDVRSVAVRVDGRLAGDLRRRGGQAGGGRALGPHRLRRLGIAPPSLPRARPGDPG